MRDVRFHSGLAISVDEASLAFRFGTGVFGPPSEMRSLNSIRRSLLDPQSAGPDPVYGICMDVGREEHRQVLTQRWLLFGAVAYASGSLGQEPVRSQGHVHARAPHSRWSPPELFEVWQGRAILYAQENSGDDPGRCFAMEAGPGEHLIVPPGWPHFVANADPKQLMVFGALCDRQYGFEYDEVRARGGMAWFPVCDGGSIHWRANPHYHRSKLLVGPTRTYPEFHVREGVSIYTQFAQDPDALQWVSDPARMTNHWHCFDPLGGITAAYES